MTTDINEHSYIGPDHQLAAHVPARPRRKVARAVVWISLLLVFALALILVLYHHEEAKKEAALLRRAGDRDYGYDGSKGQHRHLPFLPLVDNARPGPCLFLWGKTSAPVIVPFSYKAGSHVF